MNLRPIIDEMPELWLHGESGGEQLMGKEYGHYKLETQGDRILFHMQAAVTPIEPIYLWEIQVEERDCSTCRN